MKGILTLAACAFCLFCSAQGLSDPSFVASLGSESAGGGSPGGGSAPPAPDFFWELDETTGDRVDSVASLTMVSSGTGVGYDAGIITNAFKNVLEAGTEAESRIKIDKSTSLATTGASISIALWLKPNSGSAPIIAFDIYSAENSFIASIDWRFSGTTLEVQAFNNTSPFDAEVLSFASHPLRDGNWHLIAIVWDSSNGKVKYSEDGAALTISSGDITLDDDAKGTLYIKNANTNEYRADLLAVWLDHALTDDEAAWMYNSGAGRTYADY